MNASALNPLRTSLTLAACCCAALLASTSGASAQVWTGVAAACVPDESSAGSYDMSAARFQFAAGKTGAIYARCNVTNPSDAGFLLDGWNYLEAAMIDPDGIGTGSQIKVSLIRVSNSTGGVYTVATLDSNTNASTAQRVDGADFSHVFNFADYAYYVQLEVKRTATSANPNISIARLYEMLF